ncbi:MAG: UPF0175 family protein [Candidatus Acidiferrum sp.]
MEVTLHIPDDVAERLSAPGSDLSRRALEAFSLEEYKAGRLTEVQLRQLLGFQTRDALDGSLKAREIWMNYTMEDLERERAVLRRSGLLSESLNSQSTD